MPNIFTLAPQCCDAGNYLELGAQCAGTATCYGPLRPVADYYWFSIPYRLGLSVNLLVYMNIALMMLSIWLATKAFTRILSTDHEQRLIQKKIRCGIFLAASTIIHIIFFYPTLFNTLSDTPASALFLSGLWLLILAAYTSNKKNESWLLLSAGLCWGFAAWMRAFYLYPVLGGLLIYGCWWVLNRKYSMLQLSLYVALIPILAQYAVMFSAYGKFSYLNEGEMQSVSYMHLNTPHAGYDTLLPHDSYFWSPRNCQTTLGILNGIKEKKYSDVACVIESRIYFYLGTYMPTAYAFPGQTHYLVAGSSESVGSLLKNWWTNLTFEEDVELAPSGAKTADKLTAPTSSPNGFGDIKQWITLKGDTTFTFSVWLWSPFPRTINLAITRNEDERDIIVLQQFLLTPQPQRYSVTGRTHEAALYNAYIGSISPEKPITFGTHDGDYFFTWGAQLESSDHPGAYIPDDPINPDIIRVWSPILLYLNIIATLTTCVFIISKYTFFLMRSQGMAIIGALCISVAEAVAIIPEQRFVIFFMVFIWLATIAALYNFVCKTRAP